MSPLELAAMSYVAAKEDFDAARYAFRPWKTYNKAWEKLRDAALVAEKQETPMRLTSACAHDEPMDEHGPCAVRTALHGKPMPHGWTLNERPYCHACGVDIAEKQETQ